MVNVREITELDSVLELRSVWSRLLAQSRDVDFFHTLDWLEPCWRPHLVRRPLPYFVIRNSLFENLRFEKSNPFQTRAAKRFQRRSPVSLRTLPLLVTPCYPPATVPTSS